MERLVVHTNATHDCLCVSGCHGRIKVISLLEALSACYIISQYQRERERGERERERREMGTRAQSLFEVLRCTTLCNSSSTVTHHGLTACSRLAILQPFVELVTAWLGSQFMYGFYLHFNNLRFRNSQTNICCMFETCSYLIVSSEMLTCRWLKWLLDHHMIIRCAHMYMYVYIYIYI